MNNRREFLLTSATFVQAFLVYRPANLMQPNSL